MIGTVNPFSDPEFKKQILGKEGRAVDDPGAITQQKGGQEKVCQMSSLKKTSL